MSEHTAFYLVTFHDDVTNNDHEIAYQTLPQTFESPDDPANPISNIQVSGTLAPNYLWCVDDAGNICKGVLNSGTGDIDWTALSQ